MPWTYCVQLTCDLFAIANFLIVMLKPAVSSPLPPPRVVGGGHVVGPVSRCVCLSVCPFVCLSTSRIVAKRRFHWSLMLWLCLPGAKIRHCGIGYVSRFTSISHTVAGRFSRNSAKWPTPTREWIRYILGAIRWRPGSGSVWKSGFEFRIILLVEVRRVGGAIFSLSCRFGFAVTLRQARLVPG